MSDAGALKLSYMGTDPPMHAVDTRHGAEVDYAALESEYRELAGHIQAMDASSLAAAPKDQLIMTAQVSAVVCC